MSTQFAGRAIFTNKYYSSYAEASKYEIYEIKDGDPLWIHLKLDKPLGEYIEIWNTQDDEGNVNVNETFTILITSETSEPSKNNYFANDMCFLKAGQQYAQGAITKFDFDKKQTELSILLSEYKRRQSSPIVLQAVGQGSAGVWRNEVRFFSGEEGQDEPFAVAKLLCNVSEGVAKYRTALAEYKEKRSKGDPSDNELPPQGSFKDAKLVKWITEEVASRSMDVTKIYFTFDDWREFDETVYYAGVYTKYKKINGVIVYNRDGNCFYAMMELTRYLIHTNIEDPELNLYNMDTPISCDKVL